MKEAWRKLSQAASAVHAIVIGIFNAKLPKKSDQDAYESWCRDKAVAIEDSRKKDVLVEAHRRIDPFSAEVCRACNGQPSEAHILVRSITEQSQ
jgi:hypothetical protein